MNGTNNLSQIPKSANTYQSPYKPMSRHQSPSKSENINMFSNNTNQTQRLKESVKLVKKFGSLLN